MDIGQWDGANNRIEATGRPFLFVNYGADATFRAWEGANPTSFTLGEAGAGISSGKLYFMGGHSNGCMGMAYSASYPNYGIFYKEGDPDAVHLSPNGQGCGSSSAPTLSALGACACPSPRVRMAGVGG